MGRTARRLLDFATVGTAHVRARQRFEVPPGPVFVNLGAGLNVAPGWVNIDGNLSTLVAGLPGPLRRTAYRLSSGRKWQSVDEWEQLITAHTFIHHDLRRGIPLDDQTVDAVYSAHFFHHLYRDVAEFLVSETYRVLKPAGLIRINVPDLAVIVAQFQEGKTEQALDALFPRTASQERSGYSRPRSLYDFDLLARVLERAGFADVSRCERGEGRVPDLDRLEHRSRSGLYVEAVRPA